jgi:leucyl-tRNA synthetase
MKMLNLLEGGVGGPGVTSVNAVDQATSEALSILLRVLYPVAPHITHALWKDLGYAARHGDLLGTPWPVVDEAALEQDEVELVLQVNGKLRGHMRAPKSAGREQLERLALAHDAVTRYTNGQAVKKVVVVPGRLVNVVV